MKIIFDVHLTQDGTPFAVQWFDMAADSPKIALKDGDKEPSMNSLDVVTYLRDNPADRKQHGFMELTKLPGYPAGATRWDVIVQQCNAANALPEMKALKLK